MSDFNHRYKVPRQLREQDSVLDRLLLKLHNYSLASGALTSSEQLVTS